MEFPYVLHHFTGSKTTTARARANDMGMKINEHPSRRGALNAQMKRPSFAHLGHIAPELREGIDEIEVKASGNLPELIREDDIRGMLHLLDPQRRRRFHCRNGRSGEERNLPTWGWPITVNQPPMPAA